MNSGPPGGLYGPGGVPYEWEEDEYTIISPPHESPGYGYHRDADWWHRDERGWDRERVHIDPDTYEPLE